MSVLNNRPMIGWQTLLADLSLILFMVTAAAMASAPAAPAAPLAPAGNAARPATAVVRSEPLALWRAVPGATGLGPWLAGQQHDPRQQLTIAAHYAPGDGAAALAGLQATITGAGPTAARARLVLEADAAPGSAPLITASLAYDAANPTTGATQP
ncbi:MAG: hypothetical protein JSS36_08940 [Proteobacteria bacterium]|nr:hypothetical protein [Pseudomonadota bacterium]